MNKNKIDLNSLNSKMSSEKLSPEVLMALQPIDVPAIYQKMMKECPSILENTGSITANALARDCKFQSKMYNLLKL